MDNGTITFRWLHPWPNAVIEADANSARVLDWCRSFFASQGYAPSYRVIADHFGWCEANVAIYIRRLCERGYARMDRKHLVLVEAA